MRLSSAKTCTLPTSVQLSARWMLHPVRPLHHHVEAGVVQCLTDFSRQILRRPARQTTHVRTPIHQPRTTTATFIYERLHRLRPARVCGTMWTQRRREEGVGIAIAAAFAHSQRPGQCGRAHEAHEADGGPGEASRWRSTRRSAGPPATHNRVSASCCWPCMHSHQTDPTASQTSAPQLTQPHAGCDVLLA